jgi:hypothetical protein
MGRPPAGAWSDPRGPSGKALLGDLSGGSKGLTIQEIAQKGSFRMGLESGQGPRPWPVRSSLNAKSESG